jgi:ABC-type bacteriocin/lantibiotic exporter with double-glycine peptidase domain
LVLDEPTSALDVDSEELVTTTLRALPAHVIVVLIAHRMSTIKHCTRVVIVEDGQASVVGTAQEALGGNEFFRRAVQSGAFASP